MDSDEEWGHRRANMRHEVAVPGVLSDRLGIEVACVIEDISSTGMLLAIEVVPSAPSREPLKQGSLADIEFCPDAVAAPYYKLKVPVRIMWRAPIAVGITFEQSTPELRDALRKIARAAVTARIKDDAKPEMTAEQRAILKACRQKVQKLLPNLVWSMRTDLANRLRMLGDTVSQADAKAALEEAALIEDKAMAITRTVEHQFLHGFAAVSDLEQTQELTLMQLKAASSTRGSVEQAGAIEVKQVSEGNARIVAVAQAVEERHKSKFFELSVRLANVLGHPMDAKSNPLVPGVACRILWHAVTTYCDSSRVQQQLRQTMMTRVIPLLGELYDGINATLDEHGAQRIFDVRKVQSPKKD